MRSITVELDRDHAEFLIHTLQSSMDSVEDKLAVIVAKLDTAESHAANPDNPDIVIKAWKSTVTSLKTELLDTQTEYDYYRHICDMIQDALDR